MDSTGVADEDGTPLVSIVGTVEFVTDSEDGSVVGTKFDFFTGDGTPLLLDQQQIITSMIETHSISNIAIPRRIQIAEPVFGPDRGSGTSISSSLESDPVPEAIGARACLAMVFVLMMSRDNALVCLSLNSNESAVKYKFFNLEVCTKL